MLTLTQRNTNRLYDLLFGNISPKEVVGNGGYKYPKKVASGWLRREIHNAKNPNQKVDEVSVATNGKAYSTERAAMRSQTYQSLRQGTLCLINNTIVSQYAVRPAIDGGFEIHINVVKKS